MTERIVRRLRSGHVHDGERAYLTRHVKATPLEKLAVNNPAFDLSTDIETTKDGL